MTHIKIEKRGVITFGPIEDPVDLQIDHLSSSGTKTVIVSDEDGFLSTESVAGLSKFEFYEHGGDAQIASGSPVYNVLKIDGQRDSYDGGLNTWDTNTSVFRPEAINTIYTLRVAGAILPVGGNPIFHMDFLLSGTTPDTAVGFRHHQSSELTVRNVADHIHFQNVFVVFADEDLYVSGGQILIHTFGAPVTVLTSSILIKQG